MYNFSILLPSRGRPEELMKTIKSLHDKAINSGEIEYLVRVDYDDSRLDQYYQTLDGLYDSEGINYTLTVGDRGRGYPDMHLFVNQLCGQSTGRWLFLFNDDARMLSQGWDKIITDQEWPEVCVIRPGQSDALNLFPIVSRQFYEILGHFSLNAHNDTWIESIATWFDIQYHIEGVWIDHLRGQIDDETYKHTSESYAITSPDFYSEATQKLLMQDIEKIKTYLKGE